MSRNEAHDSMFLPHGQHHNFIARLRARKQSASQSTITPSEAVWFLSLPDKVRRQHFTKEEQILIRAKSELVLLDTAPDVLHHVEDNQSAPPHLRAKSVAYDTRSRPEMPSYATMPFLSATGSFKSSPSSPSMDSDEMDTPRIDSHETFLDSPFKQHRQTFLRSPTVRQSTYLGSNSPSPTMDSRPEFTRSKTTPSVRAQPPPPIHIQKTLYIKDPNAKVFLRDCLDSSKFEECLNFGFPSAQSAIGFKTTAWEAVSPGTDVRMNWLDSPADEDEEEDEEEDFMDMSSADEADLTTPTSLVHPQLVRRESTMDSPESEQDEAAESPFVPRNASNSSYFEELMSRDMTLRMTLTKPELRASDEELYGWQADYEEVPPEGLQAEKDPLALQSLVFSDDVSGLTGTFAQELAKKKGIKGLWHRK